MQNYDRTILSQFSNSPVLLGLVDYANQWFDPTANLNAFYDYVWNVETAQGYGLDVLGRIVGVTRVLSISSVPYFGFNEANEWVGFNQAPFYTGQTVTNNFTLTDDTFRSLVLAKAMFNISNGSIQSINSILMFLFSDSGQAWCTDGLDMTMTYSFDFTPSAIQLAIVSQSGVLPRPSGMVATIVHP